MTKEKAREMIAALKARREAIVAQANLDIGYVNGQIALLEQLAAEAEADDEATAATEEG